MLISDALVADGLALVADGLALVADGLALVADGLALVADGLALRALPCSRTLPHASSGDSYTGLGAVARLGAPISLGGSSSWGRDDARRRSGCIDP